MNLYRSVTEFNAGIDLHTRSMYLCVVNRNGQKLIHKKIRDNDLDYLLKLVEPYLSDLTICCESTCNWGVLHDFCERHGIHFALGHAYYIRAIADAKKKNDHADSEKLAHLLRSNLLPIGYACSRDARIVRDLHRKRLKLVRKCADLKTSLSMSMHMHGYPPLSAKEKRSHNHRRAALAERSQHELIDFGFTSYENAIEAIQTEVKRIERRLDRHLTESETNSQVIKILRSFPGIGRVLAFTIHCEIIDIERFATVKDFTSYCRLIVPEGESGGKLCGKRNGKIGNSYLNWAIQEAVGLARVHNKDFSNYGKWLESRHGSRQGKRVFAHHYGRALYTAIKRNEPFDMEKFSHGKMNLIERLRKTTESRSEI